VCNFPVDIVSDLFDANTPIPSDLSVVKQTLVRFYADQMMRLSQSMQESKKSKWHYEGQTANVMNRVQSYRKAKCRGTRYTVLCEIAGLYASHWVDLHEAASMQAALRVFVHTKPSTFSNKRFRGGEGKSRIPRWIYWVYLIEEV
jgi:hypothetical protein